VRRFGSDKSVTPTNAGWTRGLALAVDSNANVFCFGRIHQHCHPWQHGRQQQLSFPGKTTVLDADVGEAFLGRGLSQWD